MHTIASRRVVGWMILSPAIVIGVLGVGVAASGCQPSVVPAGSAGQSPYVTPATSPRASAAPGESDAPGVGATIPPFVPVPSGPYP